MSEGNPGAMNFMMESITLNPMNVIKVILPLDIMEIYGSKIYMLFNDCCNRDHEEVDKVIMAYLSGKLTKREIHANLSQGRGTPFNLSEGDDKVC